jgi:oxygen-independent coproporphyrinogen III oxidase
MGGEPRVVTPEAVPFPGQATTAADEVWLAKPVSRYTSYPPASAFSEGLTSHDYALALNALSTDQPVSVYLHIPYCRELCHFCGCNTSVTHRHERVKNYLKALRREISLVVNRSGKARRVSHLHLGGGTPNILTERQLYELLDELGERFDLSEAQEISVELDPRWVTSGQIKTLANSGMTRSSLGVQDFDPRVQKAVGREQPFAMIERLVHDLREAGLPRIGIDLMYGLPLQTPASMAETAQKTVSLTPGRIAFYAYAHRPQKKKHQKALEVIGLPDKFARLAIEQSAREVFVKAGYTPIGMDHFAKPDDELAIAAKENRLRRNFQGYTDDNPGILLGFGASAITRTHDGYFQNERDESAYRTILNKGALATVRGVHMDAEDRLRADIIETLMCTMACDLEALCVKHNYPLAGLAADLENLKVFEKAGIIECHNNTLRLTTPHLTAIRVIAHAFDAYGKLSSRAAASCAA